MRHAKNCQHSQVKSELIDLNETEIAIAMVDVQVAAFDGHFRKSSDVQTRQGHFSVEAFGEFADHPIVGELINVRRAPE